jgi:hypothetical protein
MAGLNPRINPPICRWERDRQVKPATTFKGLENTSEKTSIFRWFSGVWGLLQHR